MGEIRSFSFERRNARAAASSQSPRSEARSPPGAPAASAADALAEQLATELAKALGRRRSALGDASAATDDEDGASDSTWNL